MASLKEIRAAIKTTLESALDITVYANVPEAPQLPAIVVRPTEADFHVAMARGTDEWQFDLWVMVSAGDLDVAQDELDGYVSGAGDKSVRQAIFLARSLGLASTDATVSALTSYGDTFPAASIEHLGATLRLIVMTSGTA